MKRKKKKLKREKKGGIVLETYEPISKPLGAYLMRNIKSHFCVFIFAGFFAFLILEFLKLIMLWCFLTQKKNVSYYNAFPY